MILQPQIASESAGATTSCAISRMFLGRRPAGKTQSEGYELFRVTAQCCGVYVWDEGLFFCKFLGEVFLHKMKLHKKEA